VYLKREDLHKYGSHKGRSIPLMIKKYAKEGVRDFVISSSGNAAIAAALGTQNHNRNNPDKQVTLRIFVGNQIPENKLSKLQELTDDSITVEQCERPKQQAFQIDKEGSATFLRQSTDDLALEGYVSLAEDLLKIPNLKAVFVPTSSGTTALALAQTFLEKESGVQVHIAQTTSCSAIAQHFDTPDSKEQSIAGAIVDNVAHRKADVIEAIEKTKGSGWILTNDQIKEARKLIKDTTNIDISTNSSLSVAALQKAKAADWSWDGPVVCLVTGA